MDSSHLTGSRIRQRRLDTGQRQSSLAQSVGISPAYLNLIEHNRRRIGGKLLLDISRELGVEPGQLSGEADANLISDMQSAAAREQGLPLEDIEAMASRFPGWSALIASQQRRMSAIERITQALSDRLTHDPNIAASMHDVLSVATAIRSTASILNDPEPIELEWQARFHRNLHEDSERLAESAQSLLAYLDSVDQSESGNQSALPQEEFEKWLAQRDYFISELEGGRDGDVETFLEDVPELNVSPTIRALAATYLRRYLRDSVNLGEDVLSRFVEDDRIDPVKVATTTGQPMALVFRRISALSTRLGLKAGMVICDGSGALIFRNPLEGFPLPRYGAACPLLPLYQALQRPGQPVSTFVGLSGHLSGSFLCLAIADIRIGPDVVAPPVLESTMLIMPAVGRETAQHVDIGPGCRTCSSKDCYARREPSIVLEGF